VRLPGVFVDLDLCARSFSEFGFLLPVFFRLYGTVDTFPIHFVNRGVDFDELCALYSIADVCLVTSLRDGMNLVCCVQSKAG
jgi:glycosyl transferase family 20